MSIKIPTFLKSKVLNLFNIILLFIAAIQYSLLTSVSEGKKSILILTVDFFLDYKIKFIPGFLIFYLSVYILFVFLIIYLIRKKDAFNLSVFLMSVVLMWSLINFAHSFVFTLNGIRPEITSGGFFFAAVQRLYSSVKGVNGLPSWHASTAILCAIALSRANFQKRIYIYIWVFLICLSPLFIKMNYIVEVMLALPLPFICYSISEKAMKYSASKEIIHEITKTFTLESLVQSVAIGLRDEGTIVSLIQGLKRLEKNMNEKDDEEIRKICLVFDPPVKSLKVIIYNLASSLDSEAHLKKAKELFGKGDRSYSPPDSDIKKAAAELVLIACRPFDTPGFRKLIQEIRKRNIHSINKSSFEKASKEKSESIIYKFTSFIESHKRNIPVIKSILNNSNGHHKFKLDDIKIISKEMRKPPYEITPKKSGMHIIKLIRKKLRRPGTI